MPPENKHGFAFKLTNKLINRLTTILFYFSILFFIIGFNISDTPPVGNWYQQFMPNLNGRQITDITFLDSLNGYAVTNNLSPGDTGYILKTINGGDIWSYSFTINRGFTAIEFVNTNTGYACGGSGGGTTYLCRTTNAGLSWNLVFSPSAAKWKDMDVLSNDTLWLVDDNSLTGGVFRTTNGGASWQQQLNLGSQNPSKIYMYNARIGFVSSTAGLYKTTNGVNWTFASSDFSFSDMFMIDSLIGWKASGFMKKTTDGGMNWVNQVLPFGGNFFGNGAIEFMNKNNDTIWAVGESLIVGGSPPTRGILFRTTNGGSNWLFQLPDTSIHINRYFYGDFIRLNGWAYSINRTGIHTTTGGDTIFYTGIQLVSNNVPAVFKLYQNYPNPFNPRTVIPYKLNKAGYVRLIAYDLLGREVQKMVDQRQQAGEYEVDFMGKFTATGVYFYRLVVADEKSKQLFNETRKMLLIK